MARYADIEKIEKLLVHGIDENGDAIVSLRDVRKAIAQAENADVQDVMNCMFVSTGSYMTDECSNCGFEINWNDIENIEMNISDIRFCPYCGAKMYGKEQEMDNLKARRSDGSDGNDGQQ